jgi:hypothetical protein
MRCIYNGSAVFEWDENNLRNCEADSERLLAVVLTERGNRIRVVTAYDLDAGQKRDHFVRRLRGE